MIVIDEFETDCKPVVMVGAAGAMLSFVMATVALGLTFPTASVAVTLKLFTELVLRVTSTE